MEVSVALLLHPNKRTPEHAHRAAEICRSLGLNPTSTGRASIACRATPEVFERLFGLRPIRRPPLAPGPQDAGAPGGSAVEGDLSVPGQLADLVASVAVVPPARRFEAKK